MGWGNDWGSSWGVAGDSVTVVLASSLSLYNGDNMLSFTNSAYSVDGRYSSTDVLGKWISSKFYINQTNVNDTMVMYSVGESFARLYTYGGLYRVNGSTNLDDVTVTAGWNEVEYLVNLDGTVTTLYINNQPVTCDCDAGNIRSDDRFFIASRKNDAGDIGAFFTGDLEYIKIGNSRGSSEVANIIGGVSFGTNDNGETDHGAVWDKVDVDLYFDNWQTYFDQLPTTPVEFQNVIRIDVYSPDTGDPLWGAYDENWLVVQQQPSGVGWGLNQQMVLKLHLAL